MTFRGYATSYCDERGMFPEQAEAVIGRISGPMASRLDEHIDGYPSSIAVLFAMEVNRAAMEYIDESMPQAWFRPLFAGGAEREASQS